MYAHDMHCMCNCECEALGISDCPFKDVLIEPTHCRLLRHRHPREAIYTLGGSRWLFIRSEEESGRFEKWVS